METTENSLYSLLIGISKDVGEIKSDVKNVQINVENYNADSVKADEKVTAKLEEYFQYAKNRQDVIKDELEVQIGNIRTEVASHEKRISDLEERPKNRIWEIILQFRGLIISAVLVALVGWCMGFITDLVKVAKDSKPPIPPMERAQ